MIIGKEQQIALINDAIAESCLTKTRIANEIGVSRGAVSNWCSGRDRPTESNLVRLAVLLKKAPSYFIGRSPLATDGSIFNDGLCQVSLVGLNGREPFDDLIPVGVFKLLEAASAASHIIKIAVSLEKGIGPWY